MLTVDIERGSNIADEGGDVVVILLDGVPCHAHAGGRQALLPLSEASSLSEAGTRVQQRHSGVGRHAQPINQARAIDPSCANLRQRDLGREERRLERVGHGVGFRLGHAHETSFVCGATTIGRSTRERQACGACRGRERISRRAGGSE